MLTKKQLIERLKNAPDDARIGAEITRGGIVYTCVWPGEESNETFIINDLMKDAPIIPMKNTFSLSDYE